MSGFMHESIKQRTMNEPVFVNIGKTSKNVNKYKITIKI